MNDKSITPTTCRSTSTPSEEELAEWVTLAEEDGRLQKEARELFARRVPEVIALAAHDPLTALEQAADLLERYPESDPSGAFELLMPEDCEWPEALAYRLREALERRLRIRVTGDRRLVRADVKVRLLRRRARRPRGRTPATPAMTVELIEPMLMLAAGTRLELGWALWHRPALLSWSLLMPGRILELGLCCPTAAEFHAAERFAVLSSGTITTTWGQLWQVLRRCRRSALGAS